MRIRFFTHLHVVFEDPEVERIARIAFTVAMKRNKKVSKVPVGYDYNDIGTAYFNHYCMVLGLLCRQSERSRCFAAVARSRD
jgi:hypothetical protein